MDRSPPSSLRQRYFGNCQFLQVAGSKMEWQPISTERLVIQRPLSIRNSELGIRAVELAGTILSAELSNLPPFRRGSGLKGGRWRHLLHATPCSTRRAARLIISRVVPVMIMLIPTSVPITHNELEGHCRQTSTPRIRVTIPSNRIQTDPAACRLWKYATRSKTP